jgi:NAD(P)-dependent dehydrogenase (short-subunit alcohol dehydrogenase family)
LAVAGHIVYATMRDVEGRNKASADALRALAEEKGLQLHPLELDVLSQESADAAAATIVLEQGRIDVVMLLMLAVACGQPRHVGDEGNIMKASTTYLYLLRKTPFFTSLDTRQLRWMIEHSHEWEAQAGTVVAQCAPGLQEHKGASGFCLMAAGRSNMTARFIRRVTRIQANGSALRRHTVIAGSS